MLKGSISGIGGRMIPVVEFFSHIYVTLTPVYTVLVSAFSFRPSLFHQILMWMETFEDGPVGHVYLLASQ